VFHFDGDVVFCDVTAQIDATAVNLRRESVFDRILNQRLQQHAGNHDVERCRIKLFYDTELVAAEANNFDVEIVVDEIDFVLQRNERVAAVKESAEDGGKFQN